jgi:hypothetical protein
MLTTIFTFLSNTIFSSEIIADIPSLKARYFNDKNGKLRIRLIGLRMVIWSTCVLIAVSTDKFNLILEFAGSVFTPFCSFFIPILLYYQFSKYQKEHELNPISLRKDRIIDKKLIFGFDREHVRDGIYLGACTVVTYFGLKSTLLS